MSGNAAPAQVLIAGNPNCGKSTLFNALSGGSAHVGNYPGVTVERTSARMRLGAQDIELVEGKVIGDPIPGLAPRHSFSLLFHGPREALLPQAIYHFENETLGALEFVIVPLGPDQDHQRYEAIFN